MPAMSVKFALVLEEPDGAGVTLGIVAEGVEDAAADDGALLDVAVAGVSDGELGTLEPGDCVPTVEVGFSGRKASPTFTCVHEDMTDAEKTMAPNFNIDRRITFSFPH
jgi:hypothetical protein